jgi:PBP1b-binding outer membrane lipoprotein LpoB
MRYFLGLLICLFLLGGCVSSGTYQDPTKFIEATQGNKIVAVQRDDFKLYYIVLQDTTESAKVFAKIVKEISTSFKAE